MPAPVYRLRMPRRNRRPKQLRPTAKPQTSDQAPGEEVVQVNDQYKGGGPAPRPGPREDAQHQTGGGTPKKVSGRSHDPDCSDTPRYLLSTCAHKPVIELGTKQPRSAQCVSTAGVVGTTSGTSRP